MMQKSDRSSEEFERTVYVANLHERVTDEILYELMVQAGPVENVISPKKERPYGFIVFENAESVPYSIALFRDVQLFGRTIDMRPRNGSEQERKIHTYLEEARRLRRAVVERSIHGHQHPPLQQHPSLHQHPPFPPLPPPPFLPPNGLFPMPVNAIDRAHNVDMLAAGGYPFPEPLVPPVFPWLQPPVPPIASGPPLPLVPAHAYFPRKSDSAAVGGDYADQNDHYLDRDAPLGPPFGKRRFEDYSRSRRSAVEERDVRDEGESHHGRDSPIDRYSSHRRSSKRGRW